MASRLRSRILQLVGSPELRPVDAAIVWALSQIVLVSVLAVGAPRGAQRAGVSDAALHFKNLTYALQARFLIPLWIGILAAGLLMRRRSPGSRVLAHACMQFAVLGGVWGAYGNGFYTAWFGLGSLFGITITGLLVFDPLIVRAGATSFALGIIATTVAEQLRLIPYAPGYVGPSVEAGQLSPRFVLTVGVFIVLTTFGAVYMLIGAAQRLRRATSLIRRYVPAQLAERILAGEYTAAAHPERRKVTLFFSDVVGFTEAADQMEPEDLSALLNEYLSEMARIADAFGATVNQFVGDGIMIFFGAPEATTDRDHALRAVRMASAMQRRMAELRERWFAGGIQTPFRIRIGINTGVASVGDFGSEGRTTYSAIGNQTNLAARIQAHCEPGKVLISHTTWGLVKDEIPCVPRGEITVKGLHYPVRVYDVADEASGRSTGP